ncbi:MAG: phytanoyl-CoA dioxygenase family protein [bacterium]|jgi:ectoine hydroxylase-related dioxygenase (phytanoyl-CoA dioxygenase family)
MTTNQDSWIQYFQEHGYVAMERVFSDDEVQRMRKEADDILELILNSSNSLERQSGRLDLVRNEAGFLVRKIQPINDLSLYLSQISADSRLLDPMRALMNEEPILMEEKLNYKQPLPGLSFGFETKPRDTDRFPVHNDWAYYRAQNYPQGIISSAITLDDCPAESGPIHIWPGTHKSHLEHESVDIGLQVQPGLVDFEGGEDLLLPAGSVAFFSSLLVHNSRPNISGKPRRMMIYSHYPASAKMGVDVRNGPTRLREAPYEWEYTRMKLRGEENDVFRAETVDDPI